LPEGVDEDETKVPWEAPEGMEKTFAALKALEKREESCAQHACMHASNLDAGPVTHACMSS
jgi:hypothetical protein